MNVVLRCLLVTSVHRDVATQVIIVSGCRLRIALLFILELFLFLFNEFSDELFLVDLIFHLDIILIDLLLHDEDRLVRPILNVFILDVFKHHIESIFNIILSSTWHFFDDFRPLVANA